MYWLPFVPSQRSEVFIPATVGLADLVSLLILGDALSIPVTDVVGESNAVILLGDLSTLSVGQTVTFSGYSLGGVETSINYQIFSVVSDSLNAITLTLDGVTEVDLIDDQAAWDHILEQLQHSCFATRNGAPMLTHANKAVVQHV